jgi:BirA family biotin operon repressor/biotin-[acetyl-CoA-carboxylase] ligase
MFHRILPVLADGQPHTVKELTSQLAVSPTELEHFIKTLITYGVEFSSSVAPTYQLSEKLELLEYRCLWAQIPEYTRQQIAHLKILDRVDSTNHYVLTQEQHPVPLICLAEYQTAGRGRQGRQWVSPYASGLCLSIKQHYTRFDHSLGGLGIALAITVVRLLYAIGAREVGLKWPNDIIWRNRKLAGLLLETRIRNHRYEIVVGIGINVKMPRIELKNIDQPWVDLQTILGQLISRNTLAAMLIEHCLQTLTSYSQEGLTTFISDWYHFDLLYGQLVTLENSTFDSHSVTEPTQHRVVAVTGTACGIDEQGALLLQIGDGKQRYFYGEARIRV